MVAEEIALELARIERAAAQRAAQRMSSEQKGELFAEAYRDVEPCKGQVCEHKVDKASREAARP